MQCIIVFYKILKVQLNRGLPDLPPPPPPPSPLDPAIPNVYDEVTGEHVFPVDYWLSKKSTGQDGVSAVSCRQASSSSSSW